MFSLPTPECVFHVPFVSTLTVTQASQNSLPVLNLVPSLGAQL